MEEEQKRARLLKLRNSAISSRFNGTFTRLTVVYFSDYNLSKKIYFCYDIALDIVDNFQDLN